MCTDSVDKAVDGTRRLNRVVYCIMSSILHLAKKCTALQFVIEFLGLQKLSILFTETLGELLVLASQIILIDLEAWQRD